MKILFIGHTTDWHGSSIALYNLVSQLAKHHEIIILLPKKEGLLIDNLVKIENVIIKTFPFHLNIYPSGNISFNYLKALISVLVKNTLAKIKLKKILSEIKPDIVHCNVGPLSFPVKVCSKLGIPHVWHIREYQDLDFGMHFIPNKRSFIRLLNTQCNHNISITKGIFDYWNMHPNNSEVIYDGVFNPNKILSTHLKKKKQLLFVGRIDESKGTLEVIKAFKIFNSKYSGYKLLIAGQISDDNLYARQCKQFVYENNLCDVIAFLGERNDVYNLMSESIAIIVASRSEGFGFITVEAMANRCLVIGKNTGGTKEQFDNGLKWSGHEIALRYETIEQLVSCIKIATQENLENLLIRAFDVVKDNYTVDIHAKNVEKYYLKILDK